MFSSPALGGNNDYFHCVSRTFCADRQWAAVFPGAPVFWTGTARRQTASFGKPGLFRGPRRAPGAPVAGMQPILDFTADQEPRTSQASGCKLLAAVVAF